MVVLKSMEWSKRKGTTSKIEPSKQILLKEKLTIKITHFVDYSKTWHTEGTYTESRSNMFVTCFPWQIHFQSKKVRGKCLKIYVIRDKSLQPSLSAWLDGFHQSNSVMKGKRADVSLNLIFQLILMCFFPVTIRRIQKNQLSYSKKFSVFTTSESKSYISKRTNAFDNHRHI